MKKTLTLFFMMALMTGLSFGASSFTKDLKSAIKSDINATKSAVKSDINTTKNAVKQDIANQKQEQKTTATAKKAEKIKQIDTKLAELNKEMKATKEDKEITETERVLKVRTLQRQIDFYNNQKKALQ